MSKKRNLLLTQVTSHDGHLCTHVNRLRLVGNDIERPQGLTLVLKFSTRKYALADLMGIKVVQTKVIVVFFLKQSLPEFKLRGRGGGGGAVSACSSS